MSKEKKHVLLIIIIITVGIIIVLLNIITIINISDIKNSGGKCEEVIQLVDNLYSKNAYFVINTSETSYDIMVCNKDKQSIVEFFDGTCELYTKSKSLYVASSVTEGTDINRLDEVVSAARAVDKGNVTFKKSIDGDSRTYDIKVSGEKAMDDVFGEYKDDVKNNLSKFKSSVGSSEEPYTVYSITTNDNKDALIACNVVVGDTPYLSWKIDGYVEMMDWGIDSNILSTKGKTSDEIINDINSFMDKLSTQMNKHTDKMNKQSETIVTTMTNK